MVFFSVRVFTTYFSIKNAFRLSVWDFSFEIGFDLKHLKSMLYLRNNINDIKFS